jgi:tRNA(Phe) wybutosine-synthesizing methylase Tyw3
MYMIRIMVFNATVNNTSVISGRIVLLIAVPGENNQPAASHWHTLSHSVVSSTPSEERDSNSLYNMYYTIYKIKSLILIAWMLHVIVRGWTCGVLRITCESVYMLKILVTIHLSFNLTLMLAWETDFDVSRQRYQYYMTLTVVVLGLCCLTSLSTIFQLYCGGQFY